MSDGSDNQQNVYGPDDSLLKPQFVDNEQGLDAVKEHALEDSIIGSGKEINKIHLNAGKIDTGNVQEEEYSPYIKLARQDDLIKKSLK